MTDAIPLGRLGDPEADIARAIVFLASSDSDFVTGLTNDGRRRADDPALRPISAPA